ncbi:hypothetical protein FHP25_08630 [Vineibacter terrae]|uniref:Uncharacterized protein n=1 Tax=Vineibacter terrae TaxID=2586908 RepID=A0A5C8PRD0_9HYPH|nr:hypothetical protein [Vineibacter terrae]TXL78246.1 hypothetical protein FHP25_08630 [Vineibacter terrae]
MVAQAWASGDAHAARRGVRNSCGLDHAGLDRLLLARRALAAHPGAALRRPQVSDVLERQVKTLAGVPDVSRLGPPALPKHRHRNLLDAVAVDDDGSNDAGIGYAERRCAKAGP